MQYYYYYCLLLLNSCLFIFLFITPNYLVIAGSSLLPPNVTVPAIFGFGDSIIDPGNNNDIKTIIKCNFPPYGLNFEGGNNPTGRFSNGKIPTDLIAEMLSVTDMIPAYLQPNLNPKDLLTGVSFASGGAGYDPMTTSTASVISIGDQLKYFIEYKKKVTEMVGQQRCDYIVSKGLHFLVAGSDDIANTYFGPSTRRFHYDFDSYANLMVTSCSSYVQSLYGLGARKIAVFSAPPIGCVPSQRTLGNLVGGNIIIRDCAEDYNKLARIYNSKLSAELGTLGNKYSDAKIVYIDIYTPLLDYIQHPQNYGFEQVAKGCCGTGIIEVSILCNKLLPVCPDNTKYLFWDSYHPTETGYKLLTGSLLRKYAQYLL